MLHGIKPNNLYERQIMMMLAAFPVPIVQPSHTENQVYYMMGEQQAIGTVITIGDDVTDSADGMGEMGVVDKLLSLVPTETYDTPMSHLMYIAGVKSVVTFINDKILDGG